MYSDLTNFERLGRIIIQIKRCRQHYGTQATDKVIESYLKRHLSMSDFFFWSSMGKQPRQPLKKA
jgi:hypothetical protein